MIGFRRMFLELSFSLWGPVGGYSKDYLWGFNCMFLPGC